MNKKTKYITHAALIGAMYFALTHLQNLLIPNSATYKTPEVIEWMRKLNSVNIVTFDHTVLFDTETKLFGPY